MLDHIGLKVRDYGRAKAFYAAALAPLGYGIVMELGPELGLGYVGAGFGTKQKPSFWIGVGDAGGSMHVAFIAPDRSAVDAFYRASLEAGGKDNGAPGVRAHYHPNYYAAFVIDPDGNNIEAVCHAPA